MKLESQFTKTAILVALPRESLGNNSEVINHGTAPGPMLKEITYDIAMITVKYFSHSVFP